MIIPHSRPRFGPAFKQAMQRVLDSGYLLMGDEAQRLEQEVSSLLGHPAAAAVDSGTAALELALRALAAGHRPRVVGIPAYCCTSVLHAVLNAGCTPVPMDCDENLCLFPDAIAKAKNLDAVIVVHPFGMVEPLATASWPCPMIEDIAQSAGAQLNGRPVGTFGTITVASFHATKPWGGAYGGMVLANRGLVEQVRLMRDPDHGRESLHYAGHHQLSDLHAALALCRLAQTDEERKQRRRVFDRLYTLFEDKNIEVLQTTRGNDFRFLIRVDQAEPVIRSLRDSGIMAAKPVQVPLSRMVEADCPGVERAWNQIVSIPLLVDMSDEEFAQIEAAIKTCLTQ